jgi:hypothetical protein
MEKKKEAGFEHRQKDKEWVAGERVFRGEF